MSAIVPWTNPGGAPCCCQGACNTNAISTFYDEYPVAPVGLPSFWHRTNITPEQATLIKSGGLNWSIDVEFNGPTPLGGQNLTGGGSVSGAAIFGNNTEYGDSPNCQAIVLLGFLSNTFVFPKFHDGTPSGQTSGILHLQFFVQEASGGWPFTNSTTTASSPALFFAGRGGIYYSFPSPNFFLGFYGWEFILGSSGAPSGSILAPIGSPPPSIPTPAGSILGQTVYASFIEGEEFSAPLTLFQLNVTFAPP